MTTLSILVLVLIFVVIIIWAVYVNKQIKAKIKDKNFLAESLITGIALASFLFILTYLLGNFVLDPYLHPQISINSQCDYLSLHGEFKLKVENRGYMGEEDFNLVIHDIILKNYSINPITIPGGVRLVTTKNLSAISFDNLWSNEYCTFETSYEILSEDPRSRLPWKPVPSAKGEYVKIKCRFIPPKSSFTVHIFNLGDNRILNYEYWGKSTTSTLEKKSCSPKPCFNPFKDFVLDFYYGSKKQFLCEECTVGNYSRCFG